MYMAISLVVACCLTPVFSVVFFVIGYNINAPKKIFKKAKKRELTEDEKLLERIEKARY